MNVILDACTLMPNPSLFDRGDDYDEGNEDDEEQEPLSIALFSLHTDDYHVRAILNQNLDYTL